MAPAIELPPHAAASAKAILAHQEQSLIEAALDRPLEAFTPKTVTDPNVVKKEIARARVDGYAVCIECIHEGMSALSVPIHIPSDGVIYSVGITGPLTRTITENQSALVTMLVDIANTLTPILSLRGRAHSKSGRQVRAA